MTVDISLLGVASHLPARVVGNDVFAEGTAARRGMFTAPTRTNSVRSSLSHSPLM